MPRAASDGDDETKVEYGVSFPQDQRATTYL